MWNRTTAVFFFAYLLDRDPIFRVGGFKYFARGGVKMLNLLRSKSISEDYHYDESMCSNGSKVWLQKASKSLQICDQIWGRCRDARENGEHCGIHGIRGSCVWPKIRGKLWVRKLPSYFSGAFKACRWMFLIFFVCLVVRLFVHSFMHSFIHFVNSVLIYLFTPLLLHSQHSTHTHTHARMYSISYYNELFMSHIMNTYRYSKSICLKVVKSYPSRSQYPGYPGPSDLMCVSGDLVPRSRRPDVLQHAGICRDQASWASPIPTVPF